MIPLEQSVKNRIAHMRDSARERLTAAHLLEEQFTTCDSSYLLKLLALEILLKACHLAYCGEPGRHHRYNEFFDPIPEKVRERVLTKAAVRFPSYTDFSDPSALLAKYGEYFIELRYYYDHFGKEYSYSPYELAGLVEALLEEADALADTSL